MMMMMMMMFHTVHTKYVYLAKWSSCLPGFNPKKRPGKPMKPETKKKDWASHSTTVFFLRFFQQYPGNRFFLSLLPSPRKNTWPWPLRALNPLYHHEIDRVQGLGVGFLFGVWQQLRTCGFRFWGSGVWWENSRWATEVDGWLLWLLWLLMVVVAVVVEPKKSSLILLKPNMGSCSFFAVFFHDATWKKPWMWSWVLQESTLQDVSYLLKFGVTIFY